MEMIRKTILKKYWNEKKVTILISLKILIGIMLITKLAFIFNAPFIIGPLAASCGLIFTIPQSPVSRARNIILGHFIAVTIGLVMFNFLGETIFSIAIAGAISILLMELTRNTHPPACATAVITVISQAKIIFSIDIVAGAVLLIILAALFNNSKKIKRCLTPLLNKPC